MTILNSQQEVQYGEGKSVCSKSNMSLWFALGTETWIFTLTLAEKLPPMLRKSPVIAPRFLPPYISGDHDPALQNAVHLEVQLLSVAL